MNKYAVIMAGGSGQRLWPLSREKQPKQIIKVVNGKSLLEICVERIKEIFPLENIYIVTNQEYKSVIHDHLADIPVDNILGEPVGRDTSNAIGLAAAVISLRDPDSAMAVFSADQLLEPVSELQAGINQGFDYIEQNPEVLMTLGITAKYPHTGFGYLKHGEQARGFSKVYRVDQFREKPDIETAREYVESGQYSWNSGMFIWKTRTILAEIEKLLPENYQGLIKIADSWQTEQRDTVLADIFPQLPKISIDFGVMEKTAQVFMCKLDISWQDVGSFEALSDNIGLEDENGNIVAGDVKFSQIGSSNNIVIGGTNNHLIATIDMDDIVVVHTEDATLVCPKGESGKLKELLGLINSKYK